MRDRLRFVVHNYFRAGFFSMTVGMVGVLYGVGLLVAKGPLYWIGYLEIAIGAVIILVGTMVYKGYRQIERLRVRLKELEKIRDMQERGINYF